MMESACTFECENSQLTGILHTPSSVADIGVVVVVGGPQYRVGSHRQFVSFARSLAEQGVAVFRFDYRGMGDSDGDIRDFNKISQDIRAAIDHFFILQPQLKKIILWGLCDAASAAVFYAKNDARVDGLILLNPWVRTDSGEAKVLVKHYYLARLKNPDFWKKTLGGKLNLVTSISTLFANVKKSVKKNTPEQKELNNIDLFDESIPLPDRLFIGLSDFRSDVLIILSGEDFTADEFRELVNSTESWKNLLSSDCFETHTLTDANHTFSTQRWRSEVEKKSLDWILLKFA